MSYYLEHKRMQPLLDKARENDITANPNPAALFEAGGGGFHIWCTAQDCPKGWEGLKLNAGGFPKPCGYVAAVRWGWGECDQKERIVRLLLDTTAFELADQRPEKFATGCRGKTCRLLPIRNRRKDIAWAKQKIRWLFAQAGVRCPPIMVVRSEPFKPLIPGDLLTFADKKGEPQTFRLKPTTRFDLFRPELIGCFVSFQIKTSSCGDLINLRRALARLAALALSTPLEVEEDPEHEADFGDDGTEGGVK